MPTRSDWPSPPRHGISAFPPAHSSGTRHQFPAGICCTHRPQTFCCDVGNLFCTNFFESNPSDLTRHAKYTNLHYPENTDGLAFGAGRRPQKKDCQSLATCWLCSCGPARCKSSSSVRVEIVLTNSAASGSRLRQTSRSLVSNRFGVRGQESIVRSTRWVMPAIDSRPHPARLARRPSMKFFQHANQLFSRSDQQSPSQTFESR